MTRHLHYFRATERWALAFVCLLLTGCVSPGPSASPLTAEWVLSGIAHAENKDFDGAIADFNAALALQPDDKDALYDLGHAQSDKKDYAAAITTYGRVLALHPADKEAWLSCGVAQFYLQNYPAAIDDYNRALALDATFIDAIYSRALAQRREGNFAGAFADYDHAIELDANYWRAYNGRATTHNAHGEFLLAIADYEKRIQLEPEGDEYAWFQRGLLLRRLGRAGEDHELAAQVASWPDSWTKSVGQYLLGHLTAEQLLSLAEQTTDSQTKREQECEANYYVGMTDLLAGRVAAAQEKFRACMSTNINTFLEYTLSRAELARMAPL